MLIWRRLALLSTQLTSVTSPLIRASQIFILLIGIITFNGQSFVFSFINKTAIISHEKIILSPALPLICQPVQIIVPRLAQRGSSHPLHPLILLARCKQYGAQSPLSPKVKYMIKLLFSQFGKGKGNDFLEMSPRAFV